MAIDFYIFASFRKLKTWLAESNPFLQLLSEWASTSISPTPPLPQSQLVYQIEQKNKKIFVWFIYLFIIYIRLPGDKEYNKEEEQARAEQC